MPPLLIRELRPAQACEFFFQPVDQQCTERITCLLAGLIQVIDSLSRGHDLTFQVHRARLLTLLETMFECVIVIASVATFLPESISQFDALWTLTKTNRCLGALLMPCVSLTTVGGASWPLIRGRSPSAMTLSLCDRDHSLHHQAELHTDEVKGWSLSLSDCMRRTRVLRKRLSTTQIGLRFVALPLRTSMWPGPSEVSTLRCAVD